MSSRFVLLFIALSFLSTCRVSAADIQFRLIALQAPSLTDLLANDPPQSASVISNATSWTVEIWGSDLSDTVHGSTGLIAAYLDVFYTPAAYSSVTAQHGPLFPAFLGTEPTIDLVKGSILNFGGVTPRLDQPKGLAPDWVRVGKVQFGGIMLPYPTNMHLTGRVGVGGVGCYGRSSGSVEVVGADVLIVPDISSGPALSVVLALLAASGRRIRRVAGWSQLTYARMDRESQS